MSCRETPRPKSSSKRSTIEALKSLNSSTFFFISTTVPLIFLLWPPLKASMMLCIPLAIQQQHQQQQYSSSSCSDAVSSFCALRGIFRGQVSQKTNQLMDGLFLVFFEQEEDYVREIIGKYCWFGFWNRAMMRKGVAWRYL
ncbi:unnamed protein product [Linum trigynum]|uniref:Uncharacterized protein n=1 Tax=Linum trigynum TaxID=586398 RepID=A0AAV2F7R3_9ROSI